VGGLVDSEAENTTKRGELISDQPKNKQTEFTTPPPVEVSINDCKVYLLH
jgi:hypothetical protein